MRRDPNPPHGNQHRLVSRRMFVRGASTGISIAALWPVLSACAGSTGSGPVDTIRWGIPQEPDTLDAQRTAMTASWQALQQLGNSLVRRDLQGTNFPGLASKWQVSPDGTVVEFQVRRAVFHDGTPFDAAALEYTFARGLNPATGSPVFPSQVGSVARTEVVSPDVFRIHLDEPYGPMIDNLSTSGAAWLQPLSKTSIDRAGSNYGRQPIGLGPWKLTEWRGGDRLRFESFPGFIAPASGTDLYAPPKTSKLDMIISPEDSTRVAALQAGELDIAPIPASARGAFAGDHNVTLMRQLRKGMGLVIHFNFAIPPFDDVRVRQAMHLALDRQRIIDVAASGEGIPAFGPLPPEFPYYWAGVERIGYGYDPDRAGRLLDEAGWTTGADGIRQKDGRPFQFTILTLPNPEIVRAAQLVQEQFRAAGIALTLQTEDISAINPKLFAHDFELSFMFWTDTDPDILYREFDSSQIDDGVNWGQYRNPELDKHLRAGRQTSDPVQRAAAYAAAQKLMVEQAVWLPIYAVHDITAVRARLKGAVMHPDGYLILDNAAIV